MVYKCQEIWKHNYVTTYCILQCVLHDTMLFINLMMFKMLQNWRNLDDEVFSKYRCTHELMVNGLVFVWRNVRFPHAAIRTVTQVMRVTSCQLTPLTASSSTALSNHTWQVFNNQEILLQSSEKPKEARGGMIELIVKALLILLTWGF